MLSGNAQRHQLVLPEQLALYDYWRSKCRGGRLPTRADINPNDIKAHLPHISLTSVCKTATQMRYQIRLAGTGFWKFYGQEIQGSFIDELPIGDRRQYWQRTLSQVALRRRPTAGATRASTPVGGHLMQFWIRLPLSCDSKNVNLILGYDHFLKHADIPVQQDEPAQMLA